MKKTIVVSLAVITISCKSSRKSMDEIAGTYYNTYTQGVSHYVELKQDSTFLHYYKDDKNEMKNVGKWKYRFDEKLNNFGHKVTFNLWVSCGSRFESNDCDSGCLATIQLKNNELRFSFDMPDEENFIKRD